MQKEGEVERYKIEKSLKEKTLHLARRHSNPKVKKRQPMTS
jgi:hypothetical protein